MKPDRREILKSAALIGVVGTLTPRQLRDQRRYKIVQLDMNLMVDMLNWWRNPPDWLALPICEEIPHDAKAISVDANWRTRSIEVLIGHESFEPVPDASAPPVVPGLISELRHVKTKEQFKVSNETS